MMLYHNTWQLYFTDLQKNHTEVEGEDDAEKVYDREFKFQAVKLGREIGFVMTAVEGSREW